MILQALAQVLEGWTDVTDLDANAPIQLIDDETGGHYRFYGSAGLPAYLNACGGKLYLGRDPVVDYTPWDLLDFEVTWICPMGSKTEVWIARP